MQSAERVHKERNHFDEVSIIIDCIIKLLEDGKTAELAKIFDQLEAILKAGDDYTNEIMTIGLIEGLQNKCGWKKIDYHHAFDDWLGEITKKVWHDPIHSCESEESKKRHQQMIRDIKKDGS